MEKTVNDNENLQEKGERLQEICYNCWKELILDFYLIAEDEEGNQHLADDIDIWKDNNGKEIYKTFEMEICKHCWATQ